MLINTGRIKFCSRGGPQILYGKHRLPCDYSRRRSAARHKVALQVDLQGQSLAFSSCRRSSLVMTSLLVQPASCLVTLFCLNLFRALHSGFQGS